MNFLFPKLRGKLFNNPAALRMRAWLAFGKRKWYYLASLLVIGIVFLLFSETQRGIIVEYFQLDRESSKNDTEFAIRCNTKIHELARAYAASTEGQKFKAEDAHSLEYRFPAAILAKGGVCAHRVLLLCSAMREHGIPARKLLIGVTGEITPHVVAEVQLEGKWRVFDPHFGYYYRTASGELATVEDLDKHPEILRETVKADLKPFPKAYPVEEYHFHRYMRFNWYRFFPFKWLHAAIGKAADEWEPPFIFNKPLKLSGMVCIVLAALGACLIKYRDFRRHRREALARKAGGG